MSNIRIFIMGHRIKVRALPKKVRDGLKRVEKALLSVKKK